VPVSEAAGFSQVARTATRNSHAHDLPRAEQRRTRRVPCRCV